MLSDVCKHLDIDSGTGHQCQDLARRRFYRHKAAYLVLHQHLAVLLKFRIDCCGDVIAWNGFLVLFTILIL